MQEWFSLREIYQNYEKQIEKLDIPSRRDVNNIYVFGMGGSGIVGKLLSYISFEIFSIPIFSFNTPKTPKFITSKDFAIVISYSGNTAETLNVLRELKSKDVKHVCITSNGEMASICRNKLLVPKGFLPRQAFPHLFAAASSIVFNIENYPLIPFLSRFEETISSLTDIKVSFSKEPFLIYAWHSYYPAALRFKQQFNENSKVQSYALELPEACHNDIEGINFGDILVLRGSKEDRSYVDSFISVLEEEGKKVKQIKVKVGSYLTELLVFFYLADKLSVDLAYKKKVDWKVTRRIKKYKEKIR